MKEIKKERTITDTYYEAVDGTQFSSKEECQKYENTAKAVLREKFKKLIIEESTEYDFFSAGSDENTVYAVKMETEGDMDTVLQLYYSDNPYVLREEDNCKKYKERAYNLVNTAFTENDILFVGENYEGDIYLISTRGNIIENLQKIDRKNEEV